MHVEVSARADPGRDGRLLLAADPEPLTAEPAERIAPLLKALADPVRLRLLSLVASHADGEACVCDLNDAFDLSQPTISHHLKVLHEAGLLDREKRGVWVYYRVKRRGARRPGRAARRRRRVTPRSSPGGRRAGRYGVPRRGRRRLRHRGQRLSPDDVGLQLLENSLATGAVLVALILALQPVSASFNPVVTLVERVLGLVSTTTAARARRSPRSSGGLVGVVVANLMFDLDAVSLVDHDRVGGGQLLGEVVATLGLVLVVFGSAALGAARDRRVRRRRLHRRGVLVHQLHQLRQPGGDVARMFSDTFAGIAPASVPPFVLMQLVGGALGARARLRPAPDPRSAAGDPMTTPTVLFVCVHNAGRSQMAAGYLQHLAGDRIEVLSAGSQPADQVNPVAVEAMAEEGIDIAARAPKVLTDVGGPGVRRRRHDGLRRRVPVLPRQALRGLGARRPGRPGHRDGPCDPRRDPAAGRGADRRARRVRLSRADPRPASAAGSGSSPGRREGGR